jgi:hypothetical protein
MSRGPGLSCVAARRHAACTASTSARPCRCSVTVVIEPHPGATVGFARSATAPGSLDAVADTITDPTFAPTIAPAEAPTETPEESPSRPVTDDGDHDRFAHYARKDDVTRAYVTGEAIVALCGKKWVPTRDPKGYPICPTCKERKDAGWSL